MERIRVAPNHIISHHSGAVPMSDFPYQVSAMKDLWSVRYDPTCCIQLCSRLTRVVAALHISKRELKHILRMKKSGKSDYAHENCDFCHRKNEKLAPEINWLLREAVYPLLEYCAHFHQNRQKGAHGRPVSSATRQISHQRTSAAFDCGLLLGKEQAREL